MKKLSFLLFLMLTGVAFGQTIQMPNVIPPSPTAQNFMRYGEIPVDYSTGVPNISIPLYTIQSKRLTLPISISYHASGIKVNDISSEVGLGWVLNAGGIIARTVNDIPDESRTGIRTYANAEQFLNTMPNMVHNGYDSSCNCYPSAINLETYMSTKYNYEDLMSDRYFYSLPNGITGVFRYNYPLDNTIITLPYKPYKISRNLTSNIVTSFQIVDDNGTVYFYEKNINSNVSNSEWHLKKITSADGIDEIKLVYQYTSSVNVRNPESMVSTPKRFLSPNCNSNEVETYATESSTGSPPTNFEEAILTSIETADEIINFIYSNREDFTELKRITEIWIASKKSPNEILKKISFNQSYFGSTAADKRLKLNSVSIIDKDNLQPQTYAVSYESQMLPPYYSKDQNRKVNIDFWGYYNGSNKGSAIHNDFLPAQYKSSQYGDRKADDGFYAKACMIKDIIYPSGGKTSFKFERFYTNELYPSGPAGYFGGFRVSEIINYTENNKVSDRKTYQYSIPIFNKIEHEFYMYDQKYIDVYFQFPNDSWNQSLSCEVLYDRNLFFSEPIVSHDLMPGLPVVYGSVTEFNGTSSNNAGSTLYSYSAPDLFSYTSLIREYHTYQNDKGNYHPKLLQKVIKNSDGNVVVDENYAYSDHFIQEFNTGINITRRLNYLSYSSRPTGAVALSPSFIDEYIQSFRALNTKAYQKAELLDYSTKKTYDLSNLTKYITETTNYQYNQHNLKEKEISVTNSSGENIVTSFKYPYDYYPTLPYKTMVDKNIITPVVEQTIKNEGVQTQKIFNEYKNWGNNIIEPEFVRYQKDPQSALENRIRFLSYDEKGNVLSLKKEDGMPITYLWGYNKNFPIAEIKNSSNVEQNVSQTEYLFSNMFSQPMSLNQSYTLGTFTISADKTVQFTRDYSKNNDHEATFNISVYKSGYSLPQISDYLSMSQTDRSVTSSYFLPSGTYTIAINAGYGGKSGPYQHDINFNMTSTVEQKFNIPFHTSFEEDIDAVNTVYAKTGKKSHSGSYTINIPPASAGYSKIIVSYWGKANASSSWTYEENILDANAGFVHTIGSSYAYIDEVRMYPATAMMTTYTYDPFCKVQTSIMNPNNKAEYYDYDGFGRLKEIYLKETGDVKSIVKSFNYSLKPFVQY
ncbi:hypothetical protein [Flavobacterium anhuiense]|uniref:hypothetical protein n=1 Tax=Flavobacterium anhuiense TaxID=459526 RepID=UPI0013C4E20A|nr:hypothetical protein [Flavobacterium anhuiense]